MLAIPHRLARRIPLLVILILVVYPDTGHATPSWTKRARAAMKVMKAAAAPGDSGAAQPGGPEQIQLTTLPGLTAKEMRELGLRPVGQGLSKPGAWPREPAAPPVWNPARFAAALGVLCPAVVSPGQIKQYTGWILRYSMAFSVDPSLVAALIYQQSRCAALRRTDYGLGLAMLNLPMHRAALQSGWYHYMVRKAGSWERRSQVLNRFPFTRRALLNPQVNIYFTAGLLSVFQRQCPGLDRSSGSAPHRHPVAHFIWGDRVRDAGVEDRILRDRRRLIALYRGQVEPAQGRHKDLPLGCPLFGCPRKVTSVVGDDRDGGARLHNGIDILSDQHEAVRTVADGEVILAGVDLGDQGLKNLDPARGGMVPHSRIGPRGLLVKVRHPGGLISEYMHLSAYRVVKDQKVKRGQVLGYVGRTGMKESDAHLHMGFVLDGQHLDPMPLLGAQVLHPGRTELGRRRAATQEQRRLKRAGKRRATEAHIELPAWAKQGDGLP